MTMLVIRVVACAEAVSFDAHGNLDAAAQIELLRSYSVPTRCPAPEQRVGRQLSRGMNQRIRSSVTSMIGHSVRLGLAMESVEKITAPAAPTAKGRNKARAKGLRAQG